MSDGGRHSSGNLPHARLPPGKGGMSSDSGVIQYILEPSPTSLPHQVNVDHRGVGRYLPSVSPSLGTSSQLIRATLRSMTPSHRWTILNRQYVTSSAIDQGYNPVCRKNTCNIGWQRKHARNRWKRKLGLGGGDSSNIFLEWKATNGVCMEDSGTHS